MPAVSQVQRGSVSIAAGDGTTIDVTLSSVDTSRSIVMFTERNADVEVRMQRHTFSAYLSSATNLRFERFEASSATAVVIEYTIVEFESGAISLQTGSRAMSAATDNISITPVDLGSSFPVLTINTDLVAFAPESVPGALITTTSTAGDTLRLAVTSAPGSNDVTARWQVIEFDSAAASVQSGTLNMSSAYGGTATISAVDPGKALVSGFGYANNTAQRGLPRTYLSSATQLATTTQPRGSAISWLLTWFVIEMLDASAVESGLATIANGATAPASQPSWATAMTNGAVFSASSLPNAYCTSTTSDSARPDDSWFSISLDTPQDGVTITRTGNNDPFELAWQVIEWAGAGGPTAYELDAEAGSYSATGADATLQASRLLNAEAGSLTITGADASLVVGRVLNAEAASLTLTGADATLASDRALDAQAGALTLTGAAAGLLSARELNAEAGSLTTTGADAALALARALNAAAGSLAVTGADAGLLAARSLNAEAGALVITGADAGLEAGEDGASVLDAQPGAFTVSGQAAGLLTARLTPADAAALSITGADAGLVLGRTMHAESGSYALTGAEIGTSLARVLNADAGIFVLTGASATFDAPVRSSTAPVQRVAHFSWREYVERLDGKDRAKPDTAYEFSNGRKFEDKNDRAG